MEITRGKIKKAKKVVIYGPEGIGKSTFASHFPDPVFVDTEGSTNDMDVSRLPRPTSWSMLLEEARYIKVTPATCKTLVIDTIDWAEQLCVEHICSVHSKKGVEDFGYGTGYVYVKEEFGRFLNLLTDVIEAGVNVVLTAHAQLRKFEQPDELGAYDRWELKLGKKTSSQTSPLVKEWSDMLLFCNYKTHAVAVDSKGKKHKAQGGRRVMYTSHHPCWDAKNRYGLPEECDFSYEMIKEIIEDNVTQAASVVQRNAPDIQKIGSEMQDAKTDKQAEKPLPDFMSLPDADMDEVVDFHTGEKASRVEEMRPARSEAFRLNDYIPKALQDLMYPNLVSEEELMEAVYNRGYFPRGTPFVNLPDEFVMGCIVAGWPQVMELVKGIRSKYEIPFEQ